MTSTVMPFDGSLSAKTVFLVVFVLVALQRILANHRWNSKYKLPPQVPGIPVFGNTFQLPPFQQGLWASEQAKKYGEM